jgi:hypothetical protein
MVASVEPFKLRAVCDTAGTVHELEVGFLKGGHTILTHDV